MNNSDLILSQERQGAKDIVNSKLLPLAVNRSRTLAEATAEYIKLGIGTGMCESDSLFVEVVLPEGWTRKATDHDMWTKVLDEKGRERISVFYKASYHDRGAHASFERFYSVVLTETAKRSDIFVASVVNANGVVLMATEAGDYMDKQEDADNWLIVNRADYQDPVAYWD